MTDFKQIHSCKFIIAFIVYCMPLCSFALTPLQWLEFAKGDETMVKYYGLLLDQDGRPVRGAKVSYEIHRASLLVPLGSVGSVKTDKNGRFTIGGMKASQLYISDVTLKGYEFTRYLQPHENVTVEFRKSRTSFHHPDKKNPVVLRIRRKNKDAVFLMRSGFGLYLKSKLPDYWCDCDLEKSWVLDSERAHGAYYPDVRMTGYYDATVRAWTVRLETHGEKSGLKMLDEVLYDAPPEGYARELNMTFQCSDEHIEKYLYLRLRDCGMYARVKLSIFAGEKKISMDGEALINPFGDRSLEALEFDDDNVNYYLDMKKKTVSAMKEQKLLPKPDFEKWIKDGKAKY